jgi:HSP20 family molecular chaperone IbpA
MKPATPASRANLRSKRIAQPPRAPSWECVRLRDLTDCLSEAYDCLSELSDGTLRGGGGKPRESRQKLRAAERELMPWLPVDFAESEGFVRVLASAPGFCAADVWVGIEPLWLVVFARREDGAEPCAAVPQPAAASDKRLSRDDPAAAPQKTGQQVCGPRQTFCVCSLPAEVNPNQSVAVLANGLLAIRMPKVKRGEDLRLPDDLQEGGTAKGARGESMSSRRQLCSSLRSWWHSLRAKGGCVSVALPAAK